MRIRLFLAGAVGLIIFTSILSITLMNLLSKQARKKRHWSYLLLVTLVAGSSLAVAGYTGFTFYKSKQVGYQPTNTVTINGKEIVTHANADERLLLPMAYDTIEATHPSVVNMPEKWHGYKFWMAVTAYPKGDAVKENPHILVSNDLIDWDAPTDKLNPLHEPVSAEFEENKRPKQYDSDTHLIYNPDKDRLEVFWRYVDDVNHTFTIYRMTSTDGKTWSEKEVAHSESRQKTDWLSPAFVYENQTYKVWYVNRDFAINYRESKDGTTWSEPTVIEVPYVDKKQTIHHWHLDVQKIEDHYEMVVVGFIQKGKKIELGERHIMNLYHSTSKDNQTWTPLEPIIYPSQKKDRWDGKGIYRSALIKEADKYYVFYSGIGFNDTRGVGIAYGKDITKLKGLNYSDISDFYPK